MSLSLILLHDQMVDKQNNDVTTSITLIDIHDIARSCRTYGVKNFYVSHSSPKMRSLGRTLIDHWDSGFGSTYNPNRKDALSIVKIVTSLDEAIANIDLETGKIPKIITTSAKSDGNRVTFSVMNEIFNAKPTEEFLLALGTGWGMSAELLKRGEYFLEPIKGPTEFNHLSVRSAAAIMLDRLNGR